MVTGLAQPVLALRGVLVFRPIVSALFVLLQSRFVFVEILQLILGQKCDSENNFIKNSIKNSPPVLIGVTNEHGGKRQLVRVSEFKVRSYRVLGKA
jgi:hypothetical protein